MEEKTRFKGRLFYLGWFESPWKLVLEDSAIVDLWPIVDRTLKSMNGKRAEHKMGTDSYVLAADSTSDVRLTYKPGELLILEKEKSFDMSNVHVYLDDALIRLSGRFIEAEFGEDLLSLKADPTELAKGTINANAGRIGNCALLGRK